MNTTASAWFSANPDKAWAEKFFLGYVPVWFAFNLVVQKLGWLDTGNFWNVAQNLLMWLPYCVLLPWWLTSRPWPLELQQTTALGTLAELPGQGFDHFLVQGASLDGVSDLFLRRPGELASFVWAVAMLLWLRAGIQQRRAAPLESTPSSGYLPVAALGAWMAYNADRTGDALTVISYGWMVQHALDRGYEVVGVCRERSVSKLAAFTGRITIVPGATNDRAVIRRAVAGCDGVLTVLAGGRKTC